MIKQHITQKSAFGDCGVSCIAMVCGVSYERVMESVPPDVIPHGLIYPEMLHALKKVSGHYWSITDFMVGPELLKNLEVPDGPAILGIRKPEADYIFHYVVTDGFLLYDPMETEPVTIGEAKKDFQGNWHVVAIIKP